jgi:ATP-dependent RNA helicase RhlE
VSLESLKLNKQIITAMEDAGYSEPKDIQSKSMTRLIGGNDIIAVGPEGSGKTTTFVLGVIMRLKYAVEEAPRALILAPNKEGVQAIEEKFQLFGKHTDLRVLGLYPGGSIETQKEDISEGVDVVIGTPDRIQAVYYKSGINLNKLRMFVIDDAHIIIKQGLHPQVIQLGDSIPNCQHLVFTEVVHKKLDNMIMNFMNYPTTIEISQAPEMQIETIDLILYQVPNFNVKRSLLNFLMQDEEFEKVIVFVNTKFTAENIYKSLAKRIGTAAAIYRNFDQEYNNIDAVEEFIDRTDLRVLIVSNEGLTEINIHHIPLVLHLDVPADLDTFLNRVIKSDETGGDRLSITFATDLELSQIRKLEHMTGQKFSVEDMPAGLVVEKDTSTKNKEEDDDEEDLRPSGGGAYHDKKASNAKSYNWGYKDRLKRFGKKHRKDKKGDF